MLKRRKKITKLVLFLFVAAQLAGLSLLFPAGLEAGELSSVSDTLSNSRLSFRGRVLTTVPANAGLITVNTTASNPYTSTGSGTLMENEYVKIGTNAPLAVQSIDVTNSQFTVSGLTTEAASGDPIIATVSAVHTVTFTPISALPNGSFRVLIPATTTYDANDGLPDIDGFDFDAIDNVDNSADVSCSGGGANITFDNLNWNTATASGTGVCSSGNHCFECRYTGNGGSPAAVTMTIGAPAQNKLINPAPSGYSASHFPGQADTYTFRVRHLNSSYSQLDETLGRIAVVEAVRVTATVSPTITFHLSAVTTLGTACGLTPDVSTTVNTVPFGSISATSFFDAAHQLVVSTNASGGYSVTASESGALSLGGLGVTTIPDTTCDSGTCAASDTTASEWNTTTNKGFGYALEDLAGDCVTDTLEYTPTFDARPFGTTAEQIMSSNAPVADDSAYVCYRVIVSGTQTAGDYSNYVIYIATATF